MDRVGEYIEGLSSFDKAYSFVNTIFHKKKNSDEARNFFLKNERIILFTAAIAAQFILSPRLLTTGLFFGIYVKMKYMQEPLEKSENIFLKIMEIYIPRVIKALDPDDEVLSVTETVVAAAGVVGSVLKYMYPRTLLELSPFVTGAAFGSVMVDFYFKSAIDLTTVMDKKKNNG